MTHLMKILFLLLSVPTFAQTYTVETVPNTKLVNNSYVSNPDGILTETTVDQINFLLDSLEKKTSAQVAVVMLTSIGDEEIFDFAQQLFVKWGIGQAGNDNGLLILFVMDKRTVRFHTGYGMEGVLPDAVCKEIQRQSMVPHFKVSDYNQGMLAGVQHVVKILTDPAAAEEIRNTTTSTSINFNLYRILMWVVGIFGLVTFAISNKKKFEPSTKYIELSMSKLTWVFMYVILPLLTLAVADFLSLSFLPFILITYGYILFALLEKYYRVLATAKPFFKKWQYKEIQYFYSTFESTWHTASFFFPLPFIFISSSFSKKVKALRDTPRPCRKCNTMIPNRESENTEDAFLKDGQITEEKIGVTDYDVWKCNSCGAVEILNYPNPKSTYARCPKCQFMTYHFGAKRILQAASYQAAGNGEEERKCLHCGYGHIDKFIIPMLIAAVISNDRDNDGDSSWSSSSSDSDSGGSWGGGDSGGGGSDSSW